MSIRYEVLVDGSLTADEIYFFDHQISATGTSRYARTTGGVLTSADPYISLSNPNVIPENRVPGQLGITPNPRDQGGGQELIDSIPYADAFRFSGYGFFGVPETVRYFFRKFTLRLEWSDATLLKGRWVGLGSEFYWDSVWQSSGELTPYRGGSSVFDDGRDEREYTLTDDLGVAAYYGLLGISIYGSNIGLSGPEPAEWFLCKPSEETINLAGGGSITVDAQNISLYTNDRETHVFGTGREADYGPYAIREDHVYRQRIPLTTTPKTSGWAINYASAWGGPGSGVLSTPSVSTANHIYRQYGNVNITDKDGNDIPSTITFGSWSGPSGTDIEAVPKGSLLYNVRAVYGDDPNASVGNPGYVPPITELPLRDTSSYPSASVEGEETEIIPPSWSRVDFEEGVDVIRGRRFRVTHTGKDPQKLTGVGGTPETLPNATLFRRTLFQGGEVLTQHYDGTWTATDGSERHGTFKIWIHEDDTEKIGPPAKPNPGHGGADYCLDPWGVPWLTVGNGKGTEQWVSGDMEASHGHDVILPDVSLASPSRQVKGDHSHLLAGIEGGAVKLWTSKDTDTWITAGTIDAANTYTGATLRFDPAGLLYCLMVTDAGAVKRRVSTDSGATWEALTIPTGFPTLTPDPIDFRWDRGRWLAAVANLSGNVDLYSSPEGEAWTFEQTVATGRMPVLLPLQGRSYLILYMNLGDFSQDFNDDYFVGTWKSRRVFQYESSWSLDAAVIIRKGQGRGMAGFRNTQKAVVAFNSDKDQPLFYRSFNEGGTWQQGSEG
jgi:hypothetical protein